MGDDATMPLIKSVQRLIVATMLISNFGAALSVHLVISLIAPGDGGTLLALGSGVILLIELIVISFFGLVIFPGIAALTWHFRGTMMSRPKVSLVVSGLAGGVIGLVTSFFFAEHWFSSQMPGIVVGTTYGVIWTLMVQSFAGQIDRWEARA